MFTAAERPRSIVLPMQLNRAPCGSMCDRALWICPLFTVFLWQAERLKEWQSEVLAKNKVLPFLELWNRSDPPGVWRRPTLRSSITTAQWCTIKNGGEHVKKDELCHLSLLRSVFDPLRANSGLRPWRLRNDDVRVWPPRSDRKRRHCHRVPVTVKFQVTANWSPLTLGVNGLPGGLENPAPRSARDCMQMCVNSRKHRFSF